MNHAQLYADLGLSLREYTELALYCIYITTVCKLAFNISNLSKVLSNSLGAMIYMSLVYVGLGLRLSALPQLPLAIVASALIPF